MRFPRSLIYLSLALCCLFKLALAALGTPLAFGDDWKPIDPAELSLKAPVVEKEADAEALFWEVHVADEVNGGDVRTVLNHYIRIKIFTDRGKESQSKIDIIPLYTNTKIREVAGRTIKPDGSIILLNKDDIHERTLIKGNGHKVKATSFAMPGVEPGAIIEYRWREERGDHLTFYDRLQFQRDIPIEVVKYYIKPLSLPNFDYGMRAQFFNGAFKPFIKEKNGFYSTTMTNMPAFHEEPRMPPEDQEKTWMLVYYTQDRKLVPEQFFKDYGKRMYENLKPLLKVNDEVRKKSAEIIGDAKAPDEQLSRLFEFCHANIKRVYDDANGMTAEERARLAKENKTPADTLKHGIGTDRDIDTLFGALATAAGMEVRVANLPDRSDIFFNRGFADDYFLNTYMIAVRVGEEWRFFSPSHTYVPYGMLPWATEGEAALILDPKEPVFVSTPLSPPEKSQEKRTARLALSDDGTLEGNVRIEYTGHLAADKKEYNDDDSPAQREETLRNMVKARMSTAELSDIHIENVADPVKPFVYAYHVRIPGYAQRTGKRLFLQPAFFEHGLGPLFHQSVWYFQERFPVLSSRITVSLPASWRATSVTFNHEKIEPAASGSTYTWELRNLPPIEPEPASPAVTNLAPRLAINYFPPAGAQAASGRAFENWGEVSRWYSELTDAQSAPDDALAAKARELTASSKTEIERIRAIGRYVQNLQYISIQIGVGRYRPHAATEVFAKSYGDCKDKANLMRAMLKAVKLQSYPVLIYSGDPTYVREEWASPEQFNHCIIAIKVSDETRVPPIINHPSLGRLLIFDPTEENMPAGELPDYEQNSFALVAAGETGVLLRMPVTPPEANRLDQQTDVSLAPDGSITATIRDHCAGQAAADFRRQFRGLSRPDYTKVIEGWVSRGATGAKVSKVEPLDNAADDSFNLNVEFSDAAYAQLMQDRLLVFKPAIVSRRESLFLTQSSSRHAPVVLEPHAYTETVHVKLPAGFDVDEMPDPLKLDASFGNYSTTYAVTDGQLVFTRSLILRAATIPADQYATVRTFFERIRAAEQSPVVLAKK